MSFIGAVPATLFESMLKDNGGWNGPLVLNARSESAAKLVIKFEFFDVIVHLELRWLSYRETYGLVPYLDNAKLG